jgi:CelD/BcsL family acetyltransferase involved in cellulose biosynthesis
MYLLQKLLEDLCNEGSTDEVDFGFGDAQYKRDVCDHEKSQAAVLLFAPSAKGIALNSLRTPLIYATNTARSLLVKTGLQQKIKRAWRRRVTGTASTPPSNSSPF